MLEVMAIDLVKSWRSSLVVTAPTASEFVRTT
jgi:hypothetical protein